MAADRPPRGGWIPPGPSPKQSWQDYLAEYPDPQPKPKRKTRNATKPDEPKLML